MSLNVSYRFPEVEMAANKTPEQNVSGGTADQEYYDLLRHPIYMVIIYSLAYTTIMIFAIVGNVMVVAVVVRNQSMHTVTNYFIVNLAIADIMVALICLPMTLLSNIYTGWHFGWFMCKATPYLQGVSVCASVNTLAAIAVDRYLAICHSMELKISKKACKITIFVIWIVAFTIMIPWAVYFQLGTYKNKYQVFPVCYENWPSEANKKYYFLGAIFLCCYSVPLVLIVACYLLIGVRVWRRRAPGEKNTSLEVVHKSKVKVVKMLAIVVVLFAFSWLPLYVIRLATFYGAPPDKAVAKIVNEIINPIAQWLGSSNSGMNPIIYCFFSKRYRNGFKNAIMSCCRRHDDRFGTRTLASAMAAHSYMNGSSRKLRKSYPFQMLALGKQQEEKLSAEPCNPNCQSTSTMDKTSFLQTEG
ncbi:neuropeptide SIFamide receptor-like [Ruditapes philippinarum]|uniref:neuropeptide SIFamide receptor-like n=1 Tax=Ruditapes philippinarum TaxID=129788 RepID=UPI00295C23D2|nr:neuropeptide SIFamide receptor-like [Ruditapes philippinarum]